MAAGAIVLSCANPEPEIAPEEATAAGAQVVGTGRSDLPNQVNNSLAFPGIFRGVLDVRARSISDEMALAAAAELASFARERGLEHGLLPTMLEWHVVPHIAAATARMAQRQGLATLDTPEDVVLADARRRIAESRRALEVLVEAGVIST
jgi:malate dehydrogenase (oxaloacetate-decarboxylating)